MWSASPFFLFGEAIVRLNALWGFKQVLQIRLSHQRRSIYLAVECLYLESSKNRLQNESDQPSATILLCLLPEW